ncbi:hypothetical protein [Niabella ginsengisoli]|uniref:Transglutaminase domain-containing protein n=1 Tax=Niabella ginsengisoli TaxID=522298 RepID=A0ABS9SPG4_9BACT|nr:hypothetical protein [Niabella ginsengisoli]MCH5600249.1 hypothetical protein [Niabella ginsengisoli]
MKKIVFIWTLICCAVLAKSQSKPDLVTLNFYGDTVKYEPNIDSYIHFDDNDRSSANVTRVLTKMEEADFTPVLQVLNDYKTKEHPDDWMFYQLVRKIAESMSPKSLNYWQYTLYKFFLMYKSGYEPTLAINDSKIVFFIQSNDNVYNMLFRQRKGKTYICINYHDYAGKFDFEKEKFEELYFLNDDQERKAFSYRISKLPHFNKNDYVVKKLNFSLYENEYFFRVKINPDVKTIFKNYPVVDYEMQLNAPVSEETKESLLPLLFKEVRKLSPTEGIDYLMHFVRYAFPYEPDTKIYGVDKRLTPEQTILSDNSDCEDRVALFYFLIKELYNLPMLIVAYPNHVTVAVKFDKPIGETISYNGEQYTFCEPTPQEEELKLGEIPVKYAKQKSEIVYAYVP